MHSSLVPLALAAALAPAARSDDGAVDHTFGSGGVVTQSLNTTVGHPDDAGFRRLIRQPDGKLVAVGFARFGRERWPSTTSTATRSCVSRSPRGCPPRPTT